MRDFILPPTRKSFSAVGQYQSSEAKFHWVTAMGLVYARHAICTGAFTNAFTVIEFFDIDVLEFLLLFDDVKIVVAGTPKRTQTRHLRGVLRQDHWDIVT